jgi:hypothetical protein
MRKHCFTGDGRQPTRPGCLPQKAKILLCAAVSLAMSGLAAFALDLRGGQFFGFNDFSSFQSSAGEKPGERVLTSPEIKAGISWDELVASWNVELPDGAYLKIEARGIYPPGPTRYYVMGLWSGDPKRHPRESVLHQKDAQGGCQHRHPPPSPGL